MNYSDPNLIDVSPWTSKTSDMQCFVSTIGCSGGGDAEEAVERTMLEARREHDKCSLSRLLA